MLINNKKKKNEKIVRQNSKLIQNTMTIGSKYNFYNTSNVLYFYNTLKSKRSLENFNLDEYVLGSLNSNLNYYKDLFKKIDNNKFMYLDYIKEYKDIEKYTSIDEFLNLKLKGISFKTFLNYEKQLYKSMKEPCPVISVTGNCEASYTSPSGRNSYSKNESYSYEKLKNFVKYIENQEIESLKKLEIKRVEMDKKREKERKLRDLEKLEKKINNEKEMLIKEKQEFEEATKGHIYATEPVDSTENNQEIKIENDDDPYIKLKKLKLMLDNGQISFEEYTNMKKELI